MDKKILAGEIQGIKIYQNTETSEYEFELHGGIHHSATLEAATELIEAPLWKPYDSKGYYIKSKKIYRAVAVRAHQITGEVEYVGLDDEDKDKKFKSKDQSFHVSNSHNDVIYEEVSKFDPKDKENKITIDELLSAVEIEHEEES